MRVIPFLALVIWIQGCSEKISQSDLNQLNGYWEIEKVVLPDGSTKEYTVNTMVEFIKMDSLSGYRKKVQPRFDGTFGTSDDAEFFTVIEQAGTFILHYKNEMSEWDETLEELSDTSFSVSNASETVYNYKRFDPINVQQK